MQKSTERVQHSSCWNKAREDELIFVLLERDVAAPVAIRRWCSVRIELGKNKPDDEQITGALRMAELMEKTSGKQVIDELTMGEYQQRVNDWMQKCFGPDISSDKTERNFRFLEESLELAQANGATKDEALRLVDYVYERERGNVYQEVGGVLVTLAALCNAIGMNLSSAGLAELTRCWSKIDNIRAKHQSKPSDIRSPLPGAMKTPD